MRGMILIIAVFSFALEAEEKRLPVDRMLSAEAAPLPARPAAPANSGGSRKGASSDTLRLPRENADRTFPVEQLLNAAPPERPVAIRSTLRKVDAVNRHGGASLSGFDPVSYHLDGQPLKGTKEISTRWKQATWYFASEEHRRLFVESPERYAPQYGGYCSFGMTRGAALPVDPEIWLVAGERLYLFHDTNLRRLWETASSDSIQNATARWELIQRPNDAP